MPNRLTRMIALILERPMCLDCIAAKAAMSTEEAERIIRRIGTVLVVHRSAGVCRNCGVASMLCMVDR